jgi:uncharacterized protein YigA (DUF484 family)
MVDRPRDRPHAERPLSGSPSAGTGREPNAAAEASGEIGARDIIAYLRRHPDFLEQHPEALRLLRAPSRELGEGVFDFQHFHVERLRQDLARLNLEHRTLIAASRGTLASQGRVHKAVLAILAAGSFEQLLQTITTDMAVLLDVDIITIGVESTTSPAGRLSVQGIHLLKAGAIDALLGPERVMLLRADQPGETVFFGAAAGLVRSQGLLRLGFGRGAPLGLLCIGTRQPGRFHPGMGTEMLSFLARVISITISQWLTPRG